MAPADDISRTKYQTLSSLREELSPEAALTLFGHEAILEAMLALPEELRTMLWHAEVLGWTPEEIAQLLGIDHDAVPSVLVRARKDLRRAFEEQHRRQQPPSPALPRDE